MEAFTRGGAAGPVNIAYSGVYDSELFSIQILREWFTECIIHPRVHVTELQRTGAIARQE